MPFKTNTLGTVKDEVHFLERTNLIYIIRSFSILNSNIIPFPKV